MVTFCQAEPHSAGRNRRIGMAEFVTLVAALMAMNALSIDPMLPALPAMADSLAIAEPNQRQWIVTAYMLGLGIGALFYGSLSDRFGRRPVLLGSLGLFLAATLACMLATSLPMMLVARAAAGFFAAGSRVVAVSLVRDRFAGDRMARVMSLVFIVFILVPVVAPAFGQAVLAVASWRWIFGALLLLGLGVSAWALVRLPETLSPQNRIAIRPRSIAATWGGIVTHRLAIGYMAATGFILAGIFAFVASSQQIFFEVFGAAEIFPYAFGAVAGAMAIGSFANSRLVERIGARRISHGALVALLLLSAVRAGTGHAGLETLASFIILQALTFFCFSLVMSNFGSISMEPFARGAGAASSFQASLTTVVGAVVGAAIGLLFDGTTLPLAMGYLGCSVIALSLVFWAEQGRLFGRSTSALA
jgi:MFS transporter, DHA1 family, multidrug resistance protein